MKLILIAEFQYKYIKLHSVLVYVILNFCRYSLAMVYESNLIFNSIQNNGQWLSKFNLPINLSTLRVSWIDRACYRDKNVIVLAEGQFEHYLHTSLLEVWNTVSAIKIDLQAFEKGQDGLKYQRALEWAPL